MLQIEFTSPTPDQKMEPVKWNYDELKSSINESLDRYRGRIYDEGSIGQAKKDRAALNKVAEAIDAARKDKKKQYLEPYEEFETQAKEIINLIKSVSGMIDEQIKSHEDKIKQEKLEHIKGLYTEKIGILADLVPYERLHDPKWLNVTVSLDTVCKVLTDKIDAIIAALDSIDKLNLDSDIATAVKMKYLENFDLACALSEKDKIVAQNRKFADLTAVKAAQQSELPIVTQPIQTTAEQPIHHIDIRIYGVTKTQLSSLKTFFIQNGIQYGKIPPM